MRRSADLLEGDPLTLRRQAVPPIIVAAAALLFLPGAAARAGSSEVRTLVETAAIAGFAQDGERIAWITTSGEHDERDGAVYVRDLRAQRTSLISHPKYFTSALADMAVASGRDDVVWSHAGYASDHVEYGVAREQRGHESRSLADWDGAPVAHVSGDRSTIAWLSSDAEVATVSTLGAWRVSSPNAVDLAARGTVVAVAREGAGRCASLEDGAADGSRVVVSYAPGGCAKSRSMIVAGPRKTARALPGHWQTASLSPDGASIALVAATGTLSVADASRGAPQVVGTLGPGAWTRLRWSPDGTFLGVGQGARAVIVPAAGGAPRTVAAHAFRWSPAGTRLALQTADGSLVVAEQDGAAPRRLSVRLGEDLAWQWRDESTILVVVGAGSARSVRAIGVDGSSVRLFAVPVEAERAWFSEDGRWLEFDGDFQFGHVDVATRKAVTVGCSTDDRCVWSPDGRHVYDGNHEAGRIDHVPGGSTIVPVVENGQWTRDSSSLLLWSKGELYRIRSNGTDPTLIPVGAAADRPNVELRGRGGHLLRRFDVSATPRSIAIDDRHVAALVAGVFGPTLLEVRSRTGELLRRASVPPAALDVSLNERWAVYTHGRRIEALDLRTGAVRHVAKGAHGPIDASIEGKRVAWAENVGSHGVIRAVLLP